MLFITSLLLFASSFAWGQTFVNGHIGGVVTDKSGGVIPEVKMVLTDLGTGVSRATTTNASGAYQFLDLTPADYSIEASKSGFGTIVQKPIRVEVNGDVHVDITLDVSTVSQQITVTAAAPLLQSETSSLGQVVESRATNELPLNGRNPIALATLVPGVIPEEYSGQAYVGKNPFATGNFEISGAMASASAEFWDGAPLNTGYEHNLALIPVQDALQEFKVQTNNLSAEYGKFYGGVINFMTQTGTSKLHGSFDEFVRNKLLNANNYFNNASGAPRPAFTQNQFGANLGGVFEIPHIYNGKDKTFFFLSYGGFRLRQGQPLLLSNPTAAEQQGDFSKVVNSSGAVIPIYNPYTSCGYLNNPACATGAPVTRIQYPGNVIPQTEWDNAAAVLKNLWALPNIPGTATGLLNWVGNPPSGGATNQLTFRLDHNLNEKSRIFGRYTYDKWSSLKIDPFGTGAMTDAITGGGQPELHLEQQMVLDYSYSLSPRTIIDVNLNALDQYYNRTAVSTGYNLAQLGPGWGALQNQFTLSTLPSITTVTGLDAFIANTGSEIRETGDDYDITPSVTMVRGRNTFRIGGEYMIERYNYIQLAGATGTYAFTTTQTANGPATNQGGIGFASFLIGYMSSGSATTSDAVAAQELYPAVYFIDNIKATKRLTLNLGIRYERAGEWTERYNRRTLFDVNLTNPLAAETGLTLKGGDFALTDSPAWPSRTYQQMDNKQFAPRVGFALQLTHNTVLRGGYGLFYVPLDLNFLADPHDDPINLYTNSVTTTNTGGAVPYTTFSNPFPAGLVQPPQRNPSFESLLNGTNVTNIILPTMKMPYAQQWNFNVQRILPGNTLLDVAYAGSSGVHLTLSGWNPNQLPPADLSMGATALAASVTNPFYGYLPATAALETKTTTAGQLLRPWEDYGNLTFVNANLGNSIFESLQVMLRKDFASKGTLLISYLNSKDISDGSDSFNILGQGGGTSIQNMDNLKAEQSLSAFDVPQRLSAAYVLDLPFGHGKKYLNSTAPVVNRLISGWGVDGVTSFMRGFPLEITSASNVTDSYGGGSRPMFNATACPNGAKLAGKNTTRLTEWFNTACFTTTPAAQFGNVSRTEPNLRTDGVNNFDFAVIKSNTFGPDNKFNLALRCEVFNLFNHPQFDYPGQSSGSASFGVVNLQYNQPRLIQFGLKLSF